MIRERDMASIDLFLASQGTETVDCYCPEKNLKISNIKPHSHLIILMLARANN